MTMLAVLSVVSLLGWLALVIAGYRSYNLPRAKMFRQIAIWVSVFALIALVFKGLGL